MYASTTANEKEEASPSRGLIVGLAQDCQWIARIIQKLREAAFKLKLWEAHNPSRKNRF